MKRPVCQPVRQPVRQAARITGGSAGSMVDSPEARLPIESVGKRTLIIYLVDRNNTTQVLMCVSILVLHSWRVLGLCNLEGHPSLLDRAGTRVPWGVTSCDPIAHRGLGGSSGN
jgi:hypothetical protein